MKWIAELSSTLGPVTEWLRQWQPLTVMAVTAKRHFGQLAGPHLHGVPPLWFSGGGLLTSFSVYLDQDASFIAEKTSWGMRGQMLNLLWLL